MTNLYAENFEDAASDFSGVTTMTAIKDTDYVNLNSNVPRNGGGATNITWLSLRSEPVGGTD